MKIALFEGGEWRPKNCKISSSILVKILFYVVFAPHLLANFTTSTHNEYTQYAVTAPFQHTFFNTIVDLNKTTNTHKNYSDTVQPFQHNFPYILTPYNLPINCKNPIPRCIIIFQKSHVASRPQTLAKMKNFPNMKNFLLENYIYPFRAIEMKIVDVHVQGHHSECWIYKVWADLMHIENVLEYKIPRIEPRINELFSCYVHQPLDGFWAKCFRFRNVCCWNFYRIK